MNAPYNTILLFSSNAKLLKGKNMSPKHEGITTLKINLEELVVWIYLKDPMHQFIIKYQWAYKKNTKAWQLEMIVFSGNQLWMVRASSADVATTEGPWGALFLLAVHAESLI